MTAAAAAPHQTALLELCLDALRQARETRDVSTAAFFVPGRIEVLGKHTDYGGGRSLLCALERGICIVAVPRADDVVDITDVRTRERASFRISPELQLGAGWAVYPTTVARRMARDFSGPLRGANIAFASNLPLAAGMSSSSVLVVAMFQAIAAVNHITERAEYRGNITSDAALADYLSAVESGRTYAGFGSGTGVGTQSGSEDHTAILCARPDALVQYSFAPVRFERSVALPREYVFALGSSGVLAEKAGAARESYNSAAEQLRLAAELWRRTTGRADAVLGTALAADATAVTRLIPVLRSSGAADEALLARVAQFLEESEHIIPAAGNAIARGDVAAFGRLVDRSHQLAVTVLRNQIDQTSHLADSARLLGAHAASAFGAGFGGSVWALIDTAEAEGFLDRWRAGYHQRFPQLAGTSAFFASRPAPAARSLTIN